MTYETVYVHSYNNAVVRTVVQHGSRLFIAADIARELHIRNIQTLVTGLGERRVRKVTIATITGRGRTVTVLTQAGARLASTRHGDDRLAHWITHLPEPVDTIIQPEVDTSRPPAPRECIYPGCHRTPKETKLWCSRHRYREVYQRPMDMPVGTRRPQGVVCSVPECGQKLHGRGLCNKHYHRLKTTGDPLVTLVAERTPCSIPGCPRVSNETGLCKYHREHPHEVVYRPAKVCSQCGDKHYAKGLCRPCYTSKWFRDHHQRVPIAA
ncbi:hypothetical protein [Changpingibacter yushuensis]|uniref:hypothetical protein n=1 Tax=Changpingibacter yushuensis TaxID=2758440 RepID=UPI0015F3CC02|nr:hypothetical protein [Changpingibacter yushuensis]